MMKLNRTARFLGVTIMAAIGSAGYMSSLAAQSATQAAKPVVPAKKKTTKATAKRSADTTAKAKPKVAQPVWPVDSPNPLSGAILPAKRIVAFYGNPLAKKMGILG